MRTNDLKKGCMVVLRNGWDARIEDNRKGRTRVCTVYGDYTEMGSVYSHDIMLWVDENGFLHDVDHTREQNELREVVEALVR